MQYRVVLTRNDKHKKYLEKLKIKDLAFKRYRDYRDNNHILFPVKHVNDGGIIPVEHSLYIAKEMEETDENRYIRDKMGRLYEEKPLYGRWTILDSCPYEIEETFWVYGCDPTYERKTIEYIVNLLMKDITDEKLIKNVIVVHNKLIIYDKKNFDLVICKCKEDAQRLHHALKNAAKNNKIKNILFLGTATKSVVSEMYQMIQKETGWPMQKIYRRTTRP